MKPPTVFMGEMTNREVEAFLLDHQTVIVPTGSTEQHGPHGPLLTDVFVPQEVARRVAPRVGALVAPSINYGLSYPHVGFTGVVNLRIPTFMAVVEDVAASLATAGFTRIVFLNGHYDNTYAIAYACANAADRLPPASEPSDQLLGRDDGRGGGRVLRADHGSACESRRASAVMAINPDLVDLEHANAELPPFPEVTNGPAVHTAFFFSTPGSVHRASESGTWGDAREASADYGERYLRVVTEATVRMLDDIERTFGAMPPR